MEKAIALTDTLQLWCEGVLVTASVGAVICQGKSILFDQLYEQADMALYRAKGNGKCGYVVEGLEVNEQGFYQNSAVSMILEFQTLMDHVNGGIIIANVSDHIDIRYVSIGTQKLVEKYEHKREDLRKTLVQLLALHERGGRK